MSITSHRKTALIAFFDEAWNAGDMTACDRYLGDAYTIHHDPHDPWHGQTLTRDGFKERLRVSRAPFPDQRFTIDALVEEGDRVVAAWHWTGTMLGAVGPFPPTGRPVTMTGITVYYFSGDRITGHWQEVNRLGVFQQLQGR